LKLFHPEIILKLIKYQALAPSFSNYMFTCWTKQTETSIATYMVVVDRKTNQCWFIKAQSKMYTDIVLLEGIKRLYSSFGLVHLKPQNKLEIKKALKLILTLKY